MNTGTRWSPFTKQLVVVTLLVGAVFLVLRISDIIPPLIIALFFAYFISLGIPWVQRNTGWSRGVAAILTELFVLLLVFTVPALITPWLVNAVNGFIGTLSKVVNELLSVTPKPIEITPNLVINLGPFYQPINQWLRGVVGPEIGNLENLQGLQGLEGLLTPFASGVTTVLKGAISGIIWFFFILVVAFYVARDGERLGRFVSERVPDEWRPEFGRLWRELAMIWDSFVRGQLLLAADRGPGRLDFDDHPWHRAMRRSWASSPRCSSSCRRSARCWPQCPACRLRSCSARHGFPCPTSGLPCSSAFVYFLIQQVENLYLLPRVVGARIRLHPVGRDRRRARRATRMAGILGILLAAPTIACARVLVGYALRKIIRSGAVRRARDPGPAPAVGRAGAEARGCGDPVRHRRHAGGDRRLPVALGVEFAPGVGAQAAATEARGWHWRAGA